MSDTPLYDQLVNERLGRGPSEFQGHDEWDDSEEARAAFERGVEQAHTLEKQSAASEKADSEKQPTGAAKPGTDEKPGPEKVSGPEQDEGQAVAEPATAKAKGKAKGPTGDRSPGKPLAPA